MAADSGEASAVGASRARGVACIVASAFGFALMAFFVRLCDSYGGGISAFQKAFFRNFIALLIATPAALAAFRARQGASPERHGARRAAMLLLLRSVAGSVGIFCNFYAISHIAISDAMTLNKTSPFFAVLFSWLFLRERASRRQLLCLAIAFAGALCVIKPGWRAFGTFAAFCGLVGGIGAGLAYTCVHELGRMRFPGAIIVFVFSAFSCVASVPFVMHAGYAPMTWAQVAILVAAGCGAAIGQFGVTAAYRYAAPREIGLYDYSNIIFTALLGYFFFAQIPDAWSVLGFAAILAAAILAARRSAVQPRKSAAALS